MSSGRTAIARQRSSTLYPSHVLPAVMARSSSGSARPQGGDHQFESGTATNVQGLLQSFFVYLNTTFASIVKIDQSAYGPTVTPSRGPEVRIFTNTLIGSGCGLSSSKV